jgi:CPA2 family monovalent cation:H+ antiporter-2
LPAQAHSLILAGALISISLNSLVFAAIRPAQDWIRSRSPLARALERSDDPLAVLPNTISPARLTGHVLLVGYGRVGRRIADALAQQGIPFVVAEQNRELVERLRKRNIPAVSGNASDPEVLIQAHVARASVLVMATTDTLQMRRMVETARMLNPRIGTVLRTHSDEEAALLRDANLGQVFMGEHELALAMTRHVLTQMDAAAGAARGPVQPAMN